SGDDEEYQRIYTTKIKPRLKSEDGTEIEHAGTQSRTITVTKRVTAYTVDVTGHEGGKEIDISSPEFKIKIPKHELTQISNVGIESEPGKTVIKIPHVDLPGRTSYEKTSHKGGKFYDVTYSGPTIDLPTQKFEAGVADTLVGQPKMGKPDIQVSDIMGKGLRGQTDFSSPEINGKTGDRLQFDIKSPKIKGELGGFQGAGVKVPASGIEGKMTSPGLDDDSKGNLTFPTMRMPKFGISSPGADIEVPQLDATAPSVTIKSPGGFPGGPKDAVASRGIPEPKLDIGVKGLDLKGGVKSKIDFGAPDIGLEGSEDKFKIHHMDIPKYSVSGPTADINVPKGGIEIGGQTPKISMSDIDLNLKSPKGKGAIYISGPKFEGDMKGPSMSIEGTNVDLGEPFKGPNISMPSGKTIPIKVAVPDVDLSLKGTSLKGDMDVSVPKLEGNLKSPQTDIKGPKMDIAAPGIGIKSSSGQLKGPHIKTPQISIPDIDLNLKGPKVKGDMGISIPTVEGELKGPAVGIKGPKVDIAAPDVDLHGPELKMPKLKMPKFGVPSLKSEVPDVDVSLPQGSLDISGPKVDIAVPRLDIEAPEGKIKGPKVKMPGLHVEAPKVSVPDFDLSLKGPSLKSDMDVSVPKLEGGLKGPQIELKGPKVDIVAPDIGVKGPSGQLKGPHIKTPQISIPDIDLNLKGPKVKGDMGVSIPRVEGDLKGPAVDIKAPKVDIGAPDVDLHGPELKMPKLKMPKFGVPSLKADIPDVDVLK
ncbi:hypothetical protein E2320_013765, partial [Naja naja]